MKQDKPFPGDELRQRREDLGLTIDEVHQRTQIRPHYIQALECGDLEVLPTQCYAVGFLTTYCRLLELEPERFVAGYRACTAQARRFLGVAQQRRQLRRAAWFAEAATWLAISAVVVLGWLAYMVIVNPKTEKTDGRVEASTLDMALPRPTLDADR